MQYSHRKELLNILYFTLLLLVAFISAYLTVRIETIFIFVLIELLFLFGNMIYGFVSKNQILSVILGFLIFPVMLIGADFNQFLNMDLNIDFIITYIFSTVFLLSILNAAIGWLMASDMNDRNDQTGRYMAAAFLFVFYFMIVFGFFTPN